MTVFDRLSYQDCQVALLTQHGKQDLLKAPLEAALGCHVLHTNGYDTDSLGTFTGEVKRLGSQREAARMKAQIAMNLTGAPVGLASEGAFDTDPFTGLMPWNTEVLLWLDPRHGIEVRGLAQGPAQSAHASVRTLEALHQFAAQAQFPEHHLVVRAEPQGAHLFKGVCTWHDLDDAFRLVKTESPNGAVWVENDLRAFCNPTRQAMIRKAANDLIQKLKSPCPQCHAPGYSPIRQVGGLPCRACARQTRLPVAKVWHCDSCGHEEQRALQTDPWADPSRCDACNP